MTLSTDTVRRLVGKTGDGWSCSDYPDGLCDSNHEEKHEMVETQRESVELSGNAAKLHIGEVFSPEERSVVSNLFSGARGGYSEPEPVPQDATREPPSTGFIEVPSGKFIYFLTEEIIRLPFNVSGELFMDPKISNKGLLFFTTGHVAPGWAGRLSGTLLNMTGESVYLSRETAILYLVFSRTQDLPSGGDIDDVDGIRPERCSVHETHNDPILKMEESRDGELVHPDSGFALSTQFVTKRDLYQVLIISLTALTIIVAVLINLFG